MVVVTVIKSFYDLNRHKSRNVGDRFEATEGRAAQIAAALPGYVIYEAAESAQSAQEKAIVPEPGQTESVAAEGTTAPQTDLSKLTVAQLKALAEERGVELPERAKKAEIIALLKE